MVTCQQGARCRTLAGLKQYSQARTINETTAAGVCHNASAQGVRRKEQTTQMAWKNRQHVHFAAWQCQTTKHTVLQLVFTSARSRRLPPHAHASRRQRAPTDTPMRKDHAHETSGHLVHPGAQHTCSKMGLSSGC